MSWRQLSLAWLWSLVAACALAASPADDLAFDRRRWTLADGAPGQAVDLTQSSDGLLWLVSPTGVVSFDGSKFRTETEVYGHKLLSSSTASIRGVPDGRLAIGYNFGGLSIFSAAGVRHFVAGKDFPLGTTHCITADADNNLYASTTTGMVRLVQDQWQPVGRSKFSATKIRFDADGTLWAFSSDKVYVLRKGADDFVPVFDARGSLTYSHFRNLPYVKLQDGHWFRLHSSGALEPYQLDNPAAYTRILSGPHGTAVALRDGGLARLVRRDDGSWHEVEYYAPISASSFGAGMGGVSISSFIDREGNLWRTMADGLERIRLHRFHQLKQRDFFWLAQPGLGDQMWIGADSTPMLRLSPGGAAQATKVLTPNALLRATPDQVWVGTSTALWEFSGGTERRWDLPGINDSRAGVQALALDAHGGLLVSLARKGLWTFAGGVWHQDDRLAHLQDPTPISMLRDTRGNTWLGLTNNRLGALKADRLALLPPTANLQIGNTLSMLDVGGRLLIGGDAGVAWVDGAQVHPMKFQRRAPVQRVTGMVVDRGGQLWLHANDGLLVVPASDLAQFWQVPAQALATELFNFEDGVSGTATATRPLPSLSIGSDGRVYYATSSQVGWIDPADIRRNRCAPDVILQSLQTADGEWRPADGMRLPGHPTAVDITFTATALSIPERVRLKYRLDGVDADWREVQHDRSAHYTNLAPGTYRFQVIAANEDGVWNQQGAALTFHIQPWFWQTLWFRALCMALLLSAGVAMYRWRIASVKRHAERHAAARIEATLQERGRIARSLHDNLLQAVQALLLRFQTLQSRLPQEPELQARLERVLVYAEELVTSTRDEVVGLRNDRLPDDLFVALREAVAASAPAAEGLLAFSAVGERKQLADDTARELFYVLREAVWNSARHAQPSRIAVELRFGEDALTASVIDDGIGIRTTAAIPGHWGIVGMRERMQRLGGKIEITSPGQGTAVQLTIPASLAYA